MNDHMGNGNQRTGRHLRRFAAATVCVVTALIGIGAVVVAGSEDDSSESLSVSTVAFESSSSYVPASGGLRLRAGRPDGTFVPPTITAPAPQPTGSVPQAGRPDGSWPVPAAPEPGGVQQMSCDQSRYC